jgi:hypothetical protein
MYYEGRALFFRSYYEGRARADTMWPTRNGPPKSQLFLVWLK